MQRLAPILLLLLGCSSPKPNELAINSSKDSVLSKQLVPDAESDCVFNNDYKELTEDWLKELDITHYEWDDNLKQALIGRGQDTVFVSKGGCTHMNFLVGIKLTQDTHLLTDSAFFIVKALELASEFKFDHIENMIRSGKIRKAGNEEDINWYQVEDNDPEDNLIFNGVGILTTTNGRITPPMLVFFTNMQPRLIYKFMMLPVKNTRQRRWEDF